MPLPEEALEELGLQHDVLQHYHAEVKNNDRHRNEIAIGFEETGKS